jgi:precorrin-2/cobalt-factor-2 C20-methyltransferase
MKRLYGIGIGPGDPTLISVKGNDVLCRVGRVFTPTGRASAGSRAREILTGLAIPSERLHDLVFPMLRDRSKLSEHWKRNAEEIIENMADVDEAAFVTLGDPSIYSTWIYLRERLRQMSTDVRTETIPGVTTMSAAAARLGIPLVSGDEKLALVPVPDDLRDLDLLFESFDTVVLFKIGRRLQNLLAHLDESRMLAHCYYARQVGLENEFVTPDLRELSDEERGYLSTIIVRAADARGGSA